MNPRTRTLVAVLAAVAVAAASGSTARGEGPVPSLCGVAKAIDRILHCQAGAAQPAPASEQPGSAQEQEPNETAASNAAAAAAASATLYTSPPRQTPTRATYTPDELLVQFRAGTPPARIRAAFASVHATVERRIPQLGVYVVHVDAASRERVRAELDAYAAVDVAERNAVYHAFATTPNDAHWSLQWGLRAIGLPAVWDRTRGSARTLVAVLDTGADRSHPDVGSAIVGGLDVLGGGSATADPAGHGTSVAGIIAARTNNAVGEAGVCWVCRILSVRILDAKGAGTADVAAAGIVRAADRGARVINLSFGGPAQAQVLADAVKYAGSKGAVLVAAAGNSGVTTAMYPAAYDGVISVGGVNERNGLYPWSNRGPWVRVTAPGCNVATALRGTYENFCGTSAAAPVVAGVAALALSAKPALSPAKVLDALVRTARGPTHVIDARAALLRLGIR
jgi:subtilisin family serine protease